MTQDQLKIELLRAVAKREGMERAFFLSQLPMRIYFQKYDQEMKELVSNELRMSMNLETESVTSNPPIGSLL